MVALLTKMKISFKQAFIIVMTASMMIALVLSWIVTSVLTGIFQTMLTDTVPVSGYTIRDYEFDNQSIGVIQQPLQQTDTFAAALNIWVPLILFSLSTVLASLLFYHWKMKTPLSLLKASIKKINDNELDFSVQYAAKDEMGDLILAFESMRRELLVSFTTQWRAQEERKLLNAAFAHDIRTPLTVLKGHIDVLLRNITFNRADRTVITDTLNLLAKHIHRIETYTDQMSAMQRLGEIHMNKSEVDWNRYWLMMQRNLQQLSAMEGKTISFECNVQLPYIWIDEAIFSRILENLVANALRYASQQVMLVLDISRDIDVKVCDDGPGFGQEALGRALDPFYREGASAKTDHSDGLGLYICKILIEKHGGSIALSNRDSGGGEVTLKFLDVAKSGL